MDYRWVTGSSAQSFASLALYLRNGIKGKVPPFRSGSSRISGGNDKERTTCHMSGPEPKGALMMTKHVNSFTELAKITAGQMPITQLGMGL